LLVSILINNYNYAEFVAQAIASALAQDHEDVEVIVVDDGSSDQSPDIIRGFTPRVQFVSKTNGGQASAYNAGWSRANGDLVIFLDSDDWLYPHAAAEVVAAWRAGVTKVQFRLAMVSRSGEPNGRYLPRTMHDSDAHRLVSAFGAYGSPPGSGNAFDAQFLRKIMPMETERWRTAADTVPILLAPLYGEIVSIPEVLGAYRLHRRIDSDDLLIGNAPVGLWHEYWRIASTRLYLQEVMSKLSLKPPSTLALAPWDARIVALCVRFGGPPPDTVRTSRLRLALHTIGSTMRWPVWPWSRKFVLCLWLALIYLLPAGIARRLALQQKSLIGDRERAAPDQRPTELN
jgi:glycosyltransferase involved in cell wall biosynthesis